MEEKEIKKGTISETVILIAILISSTAVQIPKAQTTTKLSVKPETIDPTLIPGDTFTINCSVTNVVDLCTWQTKLLFDSKILNCTEAWYPSDHVFAGKTLIPVEPVIDNPGGYLQHGSTLVFGQTGFTGSGTCCQIKFEVLSRGSTALHFSEPYGVDTFLWDSNDELIPVTIQDGYFDNTHDVAISDVKPLKTSVELGDLVSVNVTVENQGVLPENFDVSVYFNTTAVGTQTVTSLPAGTSKTLKLTCKTENLEKGNYTVAANATTVPYETDISDNTFADGIITIIAYHDVAIIDVTPSKTRVVQGLSISIYVDVENQGHYTETFNVSAYYDTNLIETQTLTLTKKTSRKLTFTWNTAGVPLGNYTISAEAGVVPDEIDATDNTFTDAIVSVRESLPADIAVIEAKSFKTVVCQGYNTNINITVANLGDYTETFNVTVYTNTTIIETKEVTLTGGNSTTITFIWSTSSFAKGNYTISAYAEPVPGETDTADNTLTDGWVVVVMVGDITGPDGWPDGKCDMRDVRAVAKFFGTYIGHPNYNPNCDIDCDGKIDMKDVRTVAKEFGKTA